MTESKGRCGLTTLACLALRDLGVCAGTIINTKTVMGLPKLTEKIRSLLQRKETIDDVYSECLNGGVVF